MVGYHGVGLDQGVACPFSRRSLSYTVSGVGDTVTAQGTSFWAAKFLNTRLIDDTWNNNKIHTLSESYLH